ncbi:MAG: hemerythrin domain-containing protein [Candidatus Nitrosocaldaceae archaeon]
MSATLSLRKDHEVIEKALKALDTTVSLFKDGNDVPIAILNDTVDFVTNFIDRCHHSKEEDGLFPALNEKGMPREHGPIAVMLMEHEEGRRLASMLKDEIEKYEKDKSRKSSIIRIIESYIALLSQHIWKENNILFNIADSILREDSDKISSKLEGIERDKLDAQKREEYIKLLDRLTKQ